MTPSINFYSLIGLFFDAFMGSIYIAFNGYLCI